MRRSLASSVLAFGPCAAAVLALAVVVAPAQTAPPPMPPASQHVEGAVTGPIVESPEAMKVTSTIQCWCGGCVNQTLHECTCGLAAAEREKVAAALAAGRTPESLIAAYVAEHGPQVRIVPEKRGLDLVGWAVPFAAALAALLTLTLVLIAWKRRGAEAASIPAGGAAGEPNPAERAYREKIERDLKEFDA